MERKARTRSDGRSVLCCAVLTAVLAAGMLLLYGNCLDGALWLPVLVSLGTVCVSALCRWLLRDRRIAVLMPLLAAVVLVGVFGNSVLRGLLGFLNYVVSWWNQFHDDGVPLFSVDMVTEQNLMLFSVVLALVLSALVWSLVQRRSLWGVCLLDAIWLVVTLTIGRFSAAACVLLVVGTLGCWAERASGGVALRHITWMGIAAAALVLAAAVLPGEPMQSVETIREAAEQTVHRLRYGDGMLPNGDLYQAHTMLMEEEPALTVSSQYLTTMYLRGFVGVRYENGVWSPLPGSAYGGEQSGMLDWLEAQGMEPATQYSTYVQTDPEQQLTVNRVRVENTGADRSYLYLPYSAAAPEHGGRPLRDARYQSRGILGCRTYSFVEYSGTLPAELLQPGQWLWSPVTEEENRYTRAEAVYREFVYEHYLDMDPALEPVIHQLFWEQAKLDAPSAYEATDRIRSVLQECAAYLMLPEAVPEDREPISWFLLESHQGNSALFASAAVAAYRSCGIPARYAEGYLLREQQLSASGGQVQLTDQDGHAWAEIYLDGLGWVPVDVTPGFYYDPKDLRQMVESPQTVQRVAELDEDDDSGLTLEQIPVTWFRGSMEKLLNRVLFWVCAAVLVLLCLLCIVFLVLELRRIIIKRRFHHYAALSDMEKSRFLCQAVTNMLIQVGIGDCLGWPAGQVEAILLEKQIPVAEYARVCELMEKTVYGDEAMQPQERRVLRSFMEKLGRAQLGVLARFRLYYYL